MKILLIIGPQGSGNHIWSKILGTWANSEFWVGHKDEPHSHLWADVELWKKHNWPDVHTLISVSAPFAINGTTIFPDIKRWKEIMTDRGLPHEIAVITRDKTINMYQNERLRPVNNYQNSVDFLNGLEVDAFLSTETLMIYKEKYLQVLNKQLKYPIVAPKDLDNIVSQSFNEKYVTYVTDSPLDNVVRKVSGYK